MASNRPSPSQRWDSRPASAHAHTAPSIQRAEERTLTQPRNGHSPHGLPGAQASPRPLCVPSTPASSVFSPVPGPSSMASSSGTSGPSVPPGSSRSSPCPAEPSGASSRVWPNSPNDVAAMPAVPSTSMVTQLENISPICRGNGGASMLEQAVAARQAPYMMRPQLQENLDDGSARFKLVRYACEMLDALQSLREEGSLFDVTLRATGPCGDEGDCKWGPPVQAHKVILSGCSLYFRGMFTRGMREANMDEVLIREPNVTSDALRMLVDFAYTGEVLITQDNAQELLVGALFLEVRHVIEACTLFLENQLEPANCIGIAAFARSHGCVDLEAKARRFIYEHFCDVVRHDEILELPAEDIAEIVQQEDLNVNCESEVFAAVLRWAEHSPEHRVDQLESLLSRGVRFSNVPPMYLEQQLKRCHLIQRQPRCYSLLVERLRRLTHHRPMGSAAGKSTAAASASGGGERMDEEGANDPPPRRSGGHRVIYTAGGFYRKVMDALRSFECYDPSTREWTRLPDLPRPRCGPGVTALQGKVCVLGGRVMQCGGVHTDTCALDVYDPRSNQWSTRCHMKLARSRVSVGVMDGMIYAVGGTSGAQLLSSVERYKPRSDEWEFVTKMQEARMSLGVAVVNRLIYAIGGYDGTRRLNSVERYIPEQDLWEYASPMQQARSGSGVTVLRGKIYVVGGFDGSRQLTSVERYDPVEDKWQEVAPLLKARSGLCVAVVEDKIYALGGYDGSDFLSCVESYNPDTDTWHPETTMLCERSGHGVAVERVPTLS